MTAAGRTEPAGRLVAVEIDRDSLAAAGTFIDRERETATRDLIADNVFAPVGQEGGTFRLRLSLADRKLVFAVASADGRPVVRHMLSLTPFRRVIKDYYLICDAYYAAVRAAGAPDRLQAIDMGRRGLHDEGAGILAERLAGKIRIDHATARRLFTLVAALHWKG